MDRVTTHPSFPPWALETGHWERVGVRRTPCQENRVNE